MLYRLRIVCLIFLLSTSSGFAQSTDDGKTEFWHEKKDVQDQYARLVRSVKDSHGKCLECYQNLDAFCGRWGDVQDGAKNARAWAKAAQAAGDLQQLSLARHSLATVLLITYHSAPKPDRRIATEAESVLAAILAGLPGDDRARFQHGQTLAMLERYPETTAEFTKYLSDVPAEDDRRELATRFAAEPQLASRRVLPPVHVTLTSGRKFSIREWQGHVVVLDVWASWCAACRSSLPELKQMLVPYNSHHYAILSISVDDDLSKWKKAMADDKMTWPQAIDSDKQISALLGVQGIPRYILVDDEGVVVFETSRVKELAEPLAQVIELTDKRAAAKAQAARASGGD